MSKEPNICPITTTLLNIIFRIFFVWLYDLSRIYWWESDQDVLIFWNVCQKHLNFTKVVQRSVIVQKNEGDMWYLFFSFRSFQKWSYNKTTWQDAFSMKWNTLFRIFEILNVSWKKKMTNRISNVQLISLMALLNINFKNNTGYLIITSLY